MHFGRVIGTVVCTEKVPAFKGQRLLFVEPLDASKKVVGRPLVAIDLVSAGPGEHVFFVRGREAANALPDADNPADAAIVGIVDQVRSDAGARVNVEKTEASGEAPKSRRHRGGGS
jgi:ethanolamine utilization protein EutN